MKKLVMLLLCVMTGTMFGQYSWSGAQIGTLNAENFWVYPSAALGADGNTYLLYRYRNMNDLRVVKWNGASWTAVTSFLVSDVPNLSSINDYQSLAVDNNNHFHIAFRGNHTNGTTGIWYGYYDGAAWTFEYVFSAPTLNYYVNKPIIALDNANNPYIGFVRQYSGVSPSQDVMKCSAKSGGIWTTTDIETLIEDHGSEFDYYDFTVSPAGVPMAVYADEYNNDCLYDIRYEYYNGSAWVPTTIATSVYAAYVSIAVNSAGKVYIAYSENDGAYTNFALTLVNNTTGSFVSESLRNNAAGSDYCVSDLLFNANDDLAIFYYDYNWNTYDMSAEKIIIKEGGSWTAYTSATPSTYADFSECASTFDANKDVVIVYTNDLSERPRTISYTAGGYSAPVLPVELTSLTASARERSVVLQWKTATETNNYGFSIERAAAGRDGAAAGAWEAVGFVEGHGTSNSPNAYAFTQANVVDGTFVYRLKQIDRNGSFTYSQTVEVAVTARPAAFALGQNYPNPFNPTTKISYSLPEAGRAQLTVYTLLGKEIATLVNGVQAAGAYDVTFDASRLASGMYIYTLKSGTFASTKKLLLVR